MKHLGTKYGYYPEDPTKQAETDKIISAIEEAGEEGIVLYEALNNDFSTTKGGMTNMPETKKDETSAQR
jgi:hypothetical protein